MRIVHVSTYPPIECGIASYASYLNEALKESGNETFVISQFGAQGENVFPVYWPESISISTLVFNSTTRITPDVVHIQHEFGLFGSQMGVQVVELILRFKLADVPVVTTLHTVEEEPKRDALIILKPIVNESAAIIVHGEYQKRILANLFGNEDKIHVVPHGVRIATSVKDAKKKLGLEKKGCPSMRLFPALEVFPQDR